MGLDAATWSRLNPLLDAALDLPPAERAAWLEALPARHADLKDTLRDLLARAADVATADLLGTLRRFATLDPAAGTGLHAAASAHAAGDTFGPYRLLHELGVGGMGAVWLAERTDGLVQRRVALKLPYGPFVGDLAARIAREREILARLDHPHIARLYDAGVTAQGQPYLALEHVDGQRIDLYCKAHGLDVAARLQLFMQAARAVAQAHSQLIVHRDIKPSNLLVDAQGQVKLLDFGIARLLAEGLLDAPDLTRQDSRPLTPDYASPEQVAGHAVGTRSDVYSLGVLLFELLAGARPYRLQRQSRAALEEAILAAQVPRMSEVVADRALRRALRGDLDTIVAKALKKEERERYPSVEALVEDIERHLHSQPVLAQRDSAWYRGRKFIVRNRVAVATSALVLLTVCTGAAAALWQARVAIAERQHAQDVKDFVVAIFTDANPYEGIGTKDLKAVDLLKQADKRLQSALVGQSVSRVELTNTLGASLLALGDLAAAEPILSRSLAEAERTLPPMHDETVRALALRAQVHRMRGRPEQANQDIDRILPTLRAHADTEAGADDLRVALQQRAQTAIDIGAHAEGERLAEEHDALTASRFAEGDARRVGSAVLLALAYRQTQKFDQALVTAERAYRGAQALYGETRPHRRMIEARGMYGRALADTGDLARGIALLEATVADARALLGEKSQTAGIFLQSLVAYRIDAGDLDAAQADGTEALAILGSAMAQDSPTYGIAEHSLASARLARGQAQAALAGARHAAEVLDRTVGAGRDSAVAARTTVALALMELGRLDEAAAELEVVAPHVAALGPGHALAARVALARGTLARLRGDASAALRHLQPLADSTHTAARWQRERMRARAQIGWVQLDQGRAADASASFERALADFARLEPGATPARADAQLGLARAHLALGDVGKGLALLQQADGFWRGFDPASRHAAAVAQALAQASRRP